MTRGCIEWIAVFLAAIVILLGVLVWHFVAAEPAARGWDNLVWWWKHQGSAEVWPRVAAGVAALAVFSGAPVAWRAIFPKRD